MGTATAALPEVIHDLSIVRPWVLRWAHSLGLLEAIRDQSRSASDLAVHLGADPATCTAVADYLVAIGYVRVSDDQLELTETGQTLAQLPRDLYEPGSPMMLFDSAATELGTAWRTGGPVASRRELAYWDEVAMSPSACETIGRYQPETVHFDGSQLVGAITALLDSPTASIIDLGGSNGALVRDVAAIHSGRIGILDLSEMIPNAERNLSTLASRVALHGGSFFEPVPDDYDVYVLNAILYDYSDAQIDQLLQGLAASIPKGAHLVISELDTMFTDEYTQAESSLLLALNTGGRAHTPEEVAASARAAGFSGPVAEYSSSQRYTLVFAC